MEVWAAFPEQQGVVRGTYSGHDGHLFLIAVRAGQRPGLGFFLSGSLCQPGQEGLQRREGMGRRSWFSGSQGQRLFEATPFLDLMWMWQRPPLGVSGSPEGLQGEERRF